MFVVDRVILVAAALLLAGIVSSTLSARVGMPVLVLFLAVGMLAGPQGLGGVPFESVELAHGIGTLALALILFDGGLRTSRAAIVEAWRPALVLATGGVALTAAVTGAAAAWAFGMPLELGLLLGSIVGSTDAAAVFAVLRSRGMSLPERVRSTLEIESGSNDPMAIFLTLAMLELIGGTAAPGLDMVVLFVRQFGVGTVVGLAAGAAALRVVDRIELEAVGLYPVLVGTLGLLAFGVASALGGSGFLAIYLAGIVLGNGTLPFERGTLLFFDGVAWVAQITMFVVLGMLSSPTRLLAVAPPSLAVALVLTLIARPLAVVLGMAPFRFDRREVAFVAWGGLRGAVPIILATFPLLAGVPAGPLLFDAVFFVVLFSAVTQGWSMPGVAARLGLVQPPAPSALGVELGTVRDVDADVVAYTVPHSGAATYRALGELPLPDGALVALVTRGCTAMAPRETTTLEPGDRVFLVLRDEARADVEALFVP